MICGLLSYLSINHGSFRENKDLKLYKSYLFIPMFNELALKGRTCLF